MTSLVKVHEKASATALTYPPEMVGITRQWVDAPDSAGAPDGFRLVHATTPVTNFEQVAAGILNWRIQQFSGGDFYTDAPSVTEGAVVVARRGGIDAPCRVVWVERGATFAGFGYGTLRGHPVCGEEAFWVRRTAEGAEAGITAVSRAGRWFTKLAAPLLTIVQRRITAEYVNAFRSLD